LVHALAPDRVEYAPAAQFAHTDARAAADFPAGQVTHTPTLLAAVTAEDVPVEQLVHTAASAAA
jgi:hypothetical protein